MSVRVKDVGVTVGWDRTTEGDNVNNREMCMESCILKEDEDMADYGRGHQDEVCRSVQLETRNRVLGGDKSKEGEEHAEEVNREE